MKQIKLHFGALAASIEKQLNEQGYTLGDKEKQYNKIIDSLTRVFFFGLITPSELEKIRNKLFKKIIKDCKEMEPKKH